MSKQEYNQTAIQLLEDRLYKICGTLREMRQSLSSGPISTVELKAGTFLHYVGQLEQLSEKYLGELRAQEKKSQHEASKRDRAK